MAANPAAQAAARRQVEAVSQGAAPTPDNPKLSYLAHTLQEALRFYPTRLCC